MAASNLKGLVTLITGGASGLGKATVERFINQGASVIICDLPESEGENLAKSLGSTALFSPTDVTSETDVKNVMDIVKSRFDRLDAVVNCAGKAVAYVTYNHNKDTYAQLKEFNNMLEVNTGGTFNVTRLASQLMANNEPDKDGQRGVIINTASNAAFDGVQGQVLYAASKAAVVSMTLPISRDLARYGIRVNTIAPGLFDTSMLLKPGSLPREEIMRYFTDIVPNPSRLAHPHEFAQLVQSIIENPMLNGETIRLDGACRTPAL